jgi:SAM-dependent methyltransferase
MKSKNENIFEKEYFTGSGEIGSYIEYEAERFLPAYFSMCIELFQKLKVVKILDVGCAKGFLVSVLQNNFKILDAYGVDVSSYAISNSPLSIRNKLKVCDLNIDKLPFKDDYFDLIICMGTIEYIKNQRNLLKEIKRVLVPRGIILLTTINSVAKGDNLRNFAQPKIYWDIEFMSLGFSIQKEIAVSILKKYVEKIILYDFKRESIFKNSSIRFVYLKLIFLKLIFLFSKRQVIKFLYNERINSGYLILGYQKS